MRINCRIAAIIALGALLALLSSSGAWARSLYFTRIIQGTKYNISFLEGAIDPADPDRGFVELDLSTMQRLDVVLAARSGEIPNLRQHYQVRNINASVGTPRKEHFTFYLDQFGFEQPTQGLMSMVFVFPLPGLNHTATVAYRSDGTQVRFEEVEVPLE